MSIRLTIVSAMTDARVLLGLFVPTKTQPASPPTSRQPSAVTGLRFHASSSLMTSARDFADGIAWVVKPASSPLTLCLLAVMLIWA